MNGLEALILVVDDHATMRKVIKSNLIQMGFSRVVEAADGEEALNILSESNVAYIICDWNMPRSNGLEFLTHVRAKQAYREIPFMMVTAESDRDSVVAAVAAGVDEFLVKPFTPATLRAKFKRLLNMGKHVAVSVDAQDCAAVVAKDSLPERVADKPSILVVDDTPSNIDLISGLLSQDYRVLAATSGKMGLDIARRMPVPDLILLDIMMPEMDGMEVCNILQQDHTTSDIPIIFLTAKSEVDDIARGFDAGAVDYVTKPANPKVLRARVKTHLGLKQARDEMSRQLDTLMENARLREDVERMTRHDLKNPLSAILNTAELLMESKYLGVGQKDKLETIRKASYDMLGMINRSLDIYKMEMGTYQLRAQPIDIVLVCHRVVEESRINAHSNGIKIVYEAPEHCFVEAEELLCFSMLGNLVRNAVEAVRRGDTVKLTVRCDTQVTVSIYNPGVVPPEIKDTLFDKYVTAAKDGGTGLGTYSAKLMAETQGGTIDVESTLDAGTTFTVALNKAIQ